MNIVKSTSVIRVHIFTANVGGTRNIMFELKFNEDSHILPNNGNDLDTEIVMTEIGMMQKGVKVKHEFQQSLKYALEGYVLEFIQDRIGLVYDRADGERSVLGSFKVNY